MKESTPADPKPKRSRKRKGLRPTATAVGHQARESSAANHLKRYQYKPGQSGNPKGPPIGHRRRLTDNFLAELSDHFAINGRDAIDRMCRNDPVAYIRAIVQLMPKDVSLDVNISPFAGLTPDTLDALDRRLAALEAQGVLTIDLDSFDFKDAPTSKP